MVKITISVFEHISIWWFLFSEGIARYGHCLKWVEAAKRKLNSEWVTSYLLVTVEALRVFRVSRRDAVVNVHCLGESETAMKALACRSSLFFLPLFRNQAGTRGDFPPFPGLWITSQTLPFLWRQSDRENVPSLCATNKCQPIGRRIVSFTL